MLTEEQWRKIAKAGEPPATLEAALEKTFWLCAGRFGTGALVRETWERMALTARTFIGKETH